MNRISLELKKLILDNPEAEIVIGETDECYLAIDTSTYNLVKSVRIEYLTIFLLPRLDKLINKEDLFNNIRHELENDEEYKLLSKDELENCCNRILEQYTFKKYIVLYMY